jgi:hypothetical protein
MTKRMMTDQATVKKSGAVLGDLGGFKVSKQRATGIATSKTSACIGG